MFDDPKRRLYELDRALREAEPEENMDIQEEEEADWLQEAKDLLNESATERLPIRNLANNYGRKPESVDFARTAYADEEMRESDALYVEKPRRKGAGSLVFLAFLELVGIGFVIMWWLKWTL